MSNAQSPGFIPLQKAIEMTKTYRQNRNEVTNPVYAGKDILALSDRFDRKVFETLLAKPECVYIRLYYGMDQNMQIRPIVVAVDKDNKDILPDLSNLEEGGEGEGDDVGDDTIRCPPICPVPSPLNEP